MPKTIAKFLKEKVPEIMTEFEKAPWDYKVLGPMGMDDLAITNVYLYIGKDKANKCRRLEIDWEKSEVKEVNLKVVKEKGNA